MRLELLMTLLLVLFLTAQRDTEVQTKDSQERVAQSQYRWVEVTANAGFPGSYNFTLFTIGDQLWAMHPAGIWHSNDGKAWTRSALPYILNDAFLEYVQFKGAVYALGTFQGNIEYFTQTSRISRTTDLKRWEVVAKESNIPRRYFYASVVFNDRIWILGGEYRNTKFDDVWNSEDGVHWKQVSKNNPWRSTGGRGAVVFKNKIHLFTGEGNEPIKVYSSSDGINWNVEADPMHPVSFWGEKAIVFDNRIWLLGCNRSGAFANEVLHSSDGRNWISEHAPWTPRGGVAAAVFQGKLLMTGGKYSTGSGENIRFIYSNDVWCMEKTRND